VASFEDLAGFLADHWARLRGEGGRGFAVLARPSSSEALADLRGLLLAAYPQARWVEWAPVSRETERAGTALAFGRPLRPVPRLDQARVIVSFDDDFLYEHPNAVRHAHDFAAGRRVAEGRINRLWMVESAYTVTGGNADHRIALPPSQIPSAVACLAAALAHNGVALPAALGSAVLPLASHPLSEQMAPIAADLAAAPGASVLLAGPGQPPEVHALVHALNVALGAVDRTIAYLEAPDRPSGLDGLRGLVQDMAAGRLDTLLILGGNPAYDAPADLAFADALAKVPTSVHLAQRLDETSRRCTWHVPQAHDLESWGDARAWDGTYGVMQPLIEPLYGGKTALELLAALLGEPAARGHELVRRTFAGDDRSWRQALHDGLVEGTAWPSVTPSVAGTGWAAALLQPPPRRDEGQLELVFRASPGLYDGRFANNGWLMEMPEPLTKMTWGNAALIGPATAEGMKLRIGDHVRVRTAHGEVELPVYPMPGLAGGDGGRPPGLRPHLLREGGGGGGDGRLPPAHQRRAPRHHGHADGDGDARDAGHHPGPSRHRCAGGAGAGGAPAPAGAGDPLRRPAEGRQRGRRAHPPDRGSAAAPIRPSSGAPSSTPGTSGGWPSTSTPAWAATPAPSPARRRTTSPWWGRDEVANGREMAWIRVDRYFKGDPENPSVLFQPVTCHHCENAPCEPVCPVAATLPRRRGAQRDGLQPLRGHPVLLEQLPLQGPPLQLVQQPQEAGPHRGHGLQPRRHRARARA
jgi:molybdopterin-containing oxidoreductase family iron-sulfur binding subunit